MGKVIKINQFKDSNGYCNRERENMKEFVKLVVYVSNNCNKEIYKTKLNKLLFYIQFLYYKKNKKRLLNDDFVYDYFGPVLPDLDEKLKELNNSNIINLTKDEYGTIIEPKIKLRTEAYSEEELDIMNQVIKNFDNWSSRKLSDYSHRESFWENYIRGEVIRIENALSLKDI
ncbi:Panacea domain-containing protein [Clostridium tarantellae]|uniref:DUF4065 domain-containing protein n=1 Tax=Clostridium tarantellae TaxID=39493 RepID=A0A6I1MLT9_9CLOT|nr:Panacea domain-containing protein [Clostridium tarantellae]MPQ44456.1 DUF4065 domain-containing protein [Clostridium tarantellae]